MQLSCLDVNLEEGGEDCNRINYEHINHDFSQCSDTPFIFSQHFRKFKFQVTSSRHLKTNVEKPSTDPFKSPLELDAQIVRFFFLKKKKSPPQYKAKGSESRPRPDTTTVRFGPERRSPRRIRRDPWGAEKNRRRPPLRAAAGGGRAEEFFPSPGAAAPAPLRRQVRDSGKFWKGNFSRDFPAGTGSRTAVPRRLWSQVTPGRRFSQQTGAGPTDRPSKVSKKVPRAGGCRTNPAPGSLRVHPPVPSPPHLRPQPGALLAHGNRPAAPGRCPDPLPPLPSPAAPGRGR